MNILALLQSRAKELSVQPQKVLQHYAMERFLYRLSRSPYRERFFLKGGMLLMGMGATPARTTMDIDLMVRSKSVAQHNVAVVGAFSWVVEGEG